jgi:hypothetical protein
VRLELVPLLLQMLVQEWEQGSVQESGRMLVHL